MHEYFIGSKKFKLSTGVIFFNSTTMTVRVLPQSDKGYR